jgi:uncharacterized membrane protein
MTESSRRFFFRLLNLRGRLIVALFLALVVYLVTFPLETGLRITLTYDVSVAVFLAMHAYQINRITAQEIQNIYEDQEPSSKFIVGAAVVFSALSMVGVALMADISRNWTPLLKGLHTVSSLLAIVLSWILLQVFYAFYYAHRYYDVDQTDPALPLSKGLTFPNDEPPDYWDFLYFSFTIAMCYQTSDVTINSRSMRRITLFHAVISFLYVTAILGLVINILSNEI